MGETSAQNVALTNGAEQSAPRCVVLLCPGQSLPEPLRRAFARRGIELHECSDPHAAMTTLCLLAGLSRGRLSGTKLILLIIEPDRQRHLEDLRRAVEHYVPGVICRAFRERAPAQIAPLGEPGEGVQEEPGVQPTTPDRPEAVAPNPQPLAEPMPTPEAGERPEERTSPAGPAYAASREGPPPLRLTGVDERTPAAGSTSDPDTAVDTDPAEVSEPLTAEELSMLLADDDEDEAQES